MGSELRPTAEQQAVIDAFGRELAAPASGRSHLIVNAFAGTGKALRNDQRVVTPSGFVPISEIRSGDLVAGADGKFHSVTGVFPQGVRELWTVTFSDGNSVIADADHIWTVTSEYHRNFGLGSQEMTTGELMAAGLTRTSRGSHKYVWYLPEVAPVEFAEADLPIDPWLLGCLLGDGSLTGTVNLTNIDDEILSRTRTTAAKMGVMMKRQSDTITYNLTGRGVKPGYRGFWNPLVEALRELGLRGRGGRTARGSHERFIPDVYMTSSPHQRLELLRGLFDTDGSRANAIAVDFGTSSERLATDVRFLVESLGGVVSQAVKKTTHRDCHRLYIKMPATICPFWLERKAADWGVNPRFGPHRTIVSITPAEPAEATCISVDSADHMFLTEGFVPTHNTSTLRMMSDAQPQARGLYVAFNKSVAEAAQRVFGSHVECRTSHSLAYRHVARSANSALLDKVKTGPQRDDRQAIAKDFKLTRKFIKVLERRKSGIQERTVGGFSLASVALGAVERFCQTAATEPSQAHVVAPKNFEPANLSQYREQMWELVGPTVHALWADVLDPDGKYMKFRHDHYLKLFGLDKPVLPYDFVLLDEAQDTAPVTEDIITRQSAHALLVMVGDPSQAIYGFTGARDSMTRFEKSSMAFTSLNLTESWRFGDEIADAANRLLERTERSGHVIGRGPRGEVLHHLSKAVDDTPSVYVCRSNFDVIEAALECIGHGKKIDASSVDLTEVTVFLDGVTELKDGTRTKKGGLGPYSNWQEFEVDVEEGIPLSEGQRVGMMLLGKYLTENECRKKIREIQSESAPPEAADVKVVTIHKAKGGEWVDVSVRYDSAFRKVKDEKDPDQLWWELADPNLAYVAATRAIKVLDPGALWPVIEYGITCDPAVLLARTRGFVGALSARERGALSAARTDDECVMALESHHAAMVAMLKVLGVRNAGEGLRGLSLLAGDIVLSEEKLLKADNTAASVAAAA